jgi:hypothetical protein
MPAQDKAAGVLFCALAKIPIYFRLFTARQLRWVRTRSDDGEG